MDISKLDFPRDSSFLVTGGAGFIGSNLCEALLDAGFRVRCLDNLSTGKMKNIEALLANPLFEFIKGDIRNLDTCLDSCEGMDFVLHQAAWGSIPRSIAMPIMYEEINIRGTLNMMEAARQKKVKRFIYASSSSVYGDSERLPKKEGYEGKVLAPYALTKKANEEYGRLYWTLYGLPTFGLRYFNVFGKRQDPEGPYAAVIPKFVKQLMIGENPIINGDGRQSRDFTYIKNVIEANLRACLAPEATAGDVYNIAYGQQETLIDVYRKICRALAIEREPEFGPNRLGDIKHSLADISKAKLMLGYDPQYDFNQGLEETIDWYKANL